MNWTPLLLAGYILIVIAVVLACLRLNGWKGRILGAIIVVLAIPGGYLIHRHILYTQRPNQAAVSASDINEAIETLPTWQVLRQQDPTRWAALRQQSLEMEQAGRSQQEIVDVLQSELVGIQLSRLQQATDQEVVAYMQANLQQTALIQKQSDEACFRFLFPGVKGGINVSRLLPPEVVRHRMEVDAAMMRSAGGADKHTVTDAERRQARLDTSLIMAGLKQRYGDKVVLLVAPQQVKDKKEEAALCDITQDLWRQVMMLPADRAAGVVRLSVSAGQQSGQ